MVKGSYFGEIEIIKKMDRAFTVVCKEKKMKFYYLNRNVNVYK